ncbi:hypothetical protein MTBUT4_90044 [Magnetospirillum sp. UT-4]|nr:hypothetical protein MTBUT4_90044 [Magnetospirillum sp. UT-4]
MGGRADHGEQCLRIQSNLRPGVVRRQALPGHRRGRGLDHRNPESVPGRGKATTLDARLRGCQTPLGKASRRDHQNHGLAEEAEFSPRRTVVSKDKNRGSREPKKPKKSTKKIVSTPSLTVETPSPKKSSPQK